MKRRIIRIDEEKCNGCGACASACHEGAIGMVNGKAKLLREDYCDGLGNCLPACPTSAITFEEREAPAYDAAAVAAAQADKMKLPHFAHHSGCPGSQSRSLRPAGGCPGSQAKSLQSETAPAAHPSGNAVSWLRQWPVQIKLVPVNAPFFRGADLLIAADCTAYAYGNFHEDFIRGRVTLIGCPKLDEGDYTEKLTRIFMANDIRTVTVTRMEVPCCGGIENAVRRAVAMSGRDIPLNVVTISAEGRIL